ncbi:MAG: hypothetical protein AVDCRST_MAG41-783, partial [uncultured Corynebacteriales bacterium]
EHTDPGPHLDPGRVRRPPGDARQGLLGGRRAGGLPGDRPGARRAGHRHRATALGGAGHRPGPAAVAGGGGPVRGDVPGRVLGVLPGGGPTSAGRPPRGARRARTESGGPPGAGAHRVRPRRRDRGGNPGRGGL